MKKFASISVLTAILALLLFSCGSKETQPQQEEQADVQETQFAEEESNLYAAEPAETAGSLKIISHGPIGEARGQVQIKISFATPLTPLTTLGDSARDKILAHFKLEPKVAGTFRLLGASTVVFQPEHSLPMATEYTVTVAKGLKDIEGNELTEDFSWSFTTPLPKINIYPLSGSDHVNIEKPIQINSSVALDIESLKSHIEFVETISQAPVNYVFYESDRNPREGEDMGMYRVRYTYYLEPQPALKKNTKYTVRIQSGVMPRRGNLPTPQVFSSTFTTFPPFRFLTSEFCDYCGNYLTTIPNLLFSNPPDFENLKGYLSIEPETSEWPFLGYGCQQYSLRLHDGLLEPNTTYTVTLKPGLLDAYGQELENPQDVSFTTGGRTPKMWGPEGYQIITPNIEPTLAVKTVNIDRVFYRLAALKPEDVLVREQLSYYYSINKLMSFLQLDEEQETLTLDERDRGATAFDLRPLLRGDNYGVVAYSFRSPKAPCFDKPIIFNGLLLRTNLGIFTQFHPTGGVIKLNRLTDGEPVAGVKIKIYREDDLPALAKIWDLITNRIGIKPSPCFEGVTDSSGLLLLSGEAMARCTKRRISNKVLNELFAPEADPDDILYDQERFGFAEPPRLLIAAEKGDDWTFLQTRPGGNPPIYRFGVMSAWEAGRPLPRGTIFSEHYLYRPGDTVRLKGLSRYLLYGKLYSGKDMEYTIKLRDPQGAQKTIGKVQVNEFGTFHIEIPTRVGQSLGTYEIIAETPVYGNRIYGEFRLAEFRVPEFKVSMEIDKKIVLPNQPLDISWQGDYYFGAPMANASSSLNITRRRTNYRPPGWEAFSFGIPQYLEEQRVSLYGQYLRETIPLTQSGHGEKTIILNRSDVPYPMIYLCDVEVEDVSRQTVSASKRFIALPDHRLVGLKLSNRIAAKEDPATVEVIVSDPDGKPLPGVPVTVKLIRKEYHSVKTKTPDGRFKYEHNLVKEVVDSRNIQSAAAPATVEFIPDKAGSYFILAELTQKPKSGAAAATSLWVSGEDYTPWEDTGEDKLEIILDKKEYQVGDEAVAFIKSPFPEAELFLTVSREKIFLRETLRIKGSAYSYRFRITEEMLPNAYMGAALFRLGDPIVPVEEELGKHMEKIGFAPFKVDLTPKYLHVDVKPARRKARPAEEVEVSIRVNRADQQGHRSELTVMVVDDAVLSLTGYRPPDLVKIVYEQRGLSARVNDNRPFVIAAEELLQKGGGYGGGTMGGLTGPRVRKEFVKVAYYNPGLITDEAGSARFTLKLPDNLTAWRIMVVAVGEDDLFGYGDQQLVVSQPFLLRPVLPRFGRLGDQFFSGVAVTNLTEGPGRATVQTEVSGQAVALQDAPAAQQIKIKAGQSKTVLFPFAAQSAGAVDLKFTARFEGTYDGQAISEADALQIPLNIQNLLPTETVVAVGETKDQFLQKLKVDDSIRKDTGGLQITLSGTALTDIGEGAKYLVNYPYGCLEQTVSRLLALMQLKFLSERYDFSLEAVKPVDKVIEANLRKVLLLQNSDGGFKFWPNSQRSDCYLSPYVAYLFKRGREFGYQIPDDALKKLIDYMDKTLRSPCYPLSGWKSIAEYRIRILIGLHYLGRKDETYFEEYYNRRNDLSYSAQMELAYLLFQSPDWKNEARQMLEEIQNGLFITAQTAHFETPRELPPSWSYLDSPVISTAEAIKLYLEMAPKSPLIGKFARYILKARKNGRWKNTYENAKAIDGLVEISLKREAEAPDYTAQVLLAGKQVLEHLFKGYRYQPYEKFIPMSELPAGLNDVLISKEGQGRLYYTLSYAYRLKGPQPARKEGFSIKRTLRRKESGDVLVTFENQTPAPVKIKAGEVLEVELEYSAPQTGYHLVIDDPIPAGLEAIDASLKTTSARYESPRQRRVTRGGYGRNPVNHTELRDDRVMLFADEVRPGIYQYRYLLRATTPGMFFWPGARISLMYEPEQFGTCAEGFVRVEK